VSALSLSTRAAKTWILADDTLALLVPARTADRKEKRGIAQARFCWPTLHAVQVGHIPA